MTAERAAVHIRALTRLIGSVTDSQIDEIYFLIGTELQRRQDQADKKATAARNAPT